MRVAIVGAGPSGLVAAKALLQTPVCPQGTNFSITIFERRSGIGGAWNYTPNPSRHGIRKPRQVPCIDPSMADPPRRVQPDGQTRALLTWDTPMYRDLYTNIPADLMAYDDFPFSSRHGSLLDQFPHRESVLNYLGKYAEGLESLIRFNCEVKSISKVDSSWRVVWQETAFSDVAGQEQGMYDRVIMASGHYEVPKIPDIIGIRRYDELFPKRLQHSKYYRSPEEYIGKRVLVIGAGPSAVDISAQLAGEGITVYRSARSDSSALVSDNSRVLLVPEITSFNKDGTIQLVDDRILPMFDVVLFCTGYLYSFPALRLAEDHNVVSEDGEYLQNLYKQMIYVHDPSLAFLAMQMSTSINPCVRQTSRLIDV